LQAIKSCASIKQGDFVFSNQVRLIETTLSKYNIKLPSNETINKQIANALKISNNYTYTDVLTVLGTKSIQSAEELTFLLLATGLLVASQKSSSLSSSSENVSLSNALLNPIKIAIKSPTRVAADIDLSSLNIRVYTRQSTSAGIVSLTKEILEEGVTTAGSTIVLSLNDLAQVLEITILRIGGFLEGLEAIESIEVQANYLTTFSAEPLTISQNLISITS
jgi:hypothetical protein